jgi:hypothetical protein
MNLGIDERAVSLEPFEGMPRVAVLLVVAIGSTTIGEQDHDLVDRLWVLAEVVLQKHHQIGRSTTIKRGNIPRTCQHPSSESEGRASECG